MNADNRQDVAVSWDRCDVGFVLPPGLDKPALQTCMAGETWPENWAVAGFENGQQYTAWFGVIGPPRAADGAAVRAKINQIIKQQEVACAH